MNVLCQLRRFSPTFCCVFVLLQPSTRVYRAEEEEMNMSRRGLHGLFSFLHPHLPPAEDQLQKQGLRLFLPSPARTWFLHVWVSFSKIFFPIKLWILINKPTECLNMWVLCRPSASRGQQINTCRVAAVASCVAATCCCISGKVQFRRC